MRRSAIADTTPTRTIPASIPKRVPGPAEERTVKSPPTVRDMHKASAIPSDRLAQAFPTSRVLTVTTAEPAATFGLEDLPENPFDS